MGPRTAAKWQQQGGAWLEELALELVSDPEVAQTAVQFASAAGGNSDATCDAAFGAALSALGDAQADKPARLEAARHVLQLSESALEAPPLAGVTQRKSLAFTALLLRHLRTSNGGLLSTGLVSTTLAGLNGLAVVNGQGGDLAKLRLRALVSAANVCALCVRQRPSLADLSRAALSQLVATLSAQTPAPPPRCSAFPQVHERGRGTLAAAVRALADEGPERDENVAFLESQLGPGVLEKQLAAASKAFAEAQQQAEGRGERNPETWIDAIERLNRLLSESRWRWSWRNGAGAGGSGAGGTAACELAAAAASLPPMPAPALAPSSPLEAALACPLTGRRMQDPCVLSCGHSFERAAVQRWLAAQATCPLKGEAVEAGNLRPNLTLRQLLESLG
eukprot:scaffold4.g4712.t1